VRVSDDDFAKQSQCAPLNLQPPANTPVLSVWSCPGAARSSSRYWSWWNTALATANANRASSIDGPNPVAIWKLAAKKHA